MDLGCYCIYPAVYYWGQPKKISATAGILSNGVDGSGAAILSYSNTQVVLTYSKVGQDKIGSQIIGDEGTITIGSISKLTDINLYSKDGSKTLLAGDMPKSVIMSYEAQAFLDAIKATQATGAEYANSEKTALQVSKVMAEIRQLACICID